MEIGRQIQELLELSEGIGITVRMVPGSIVDDGHPGGAMVCLKGRDVLFLNPAASQADQLAVLTEALRDRPELADRYLRPDLRELLESGGEAGEA
jgi:hypothetical protein